MYPKLRPLLFALDPEQAHALSLTAMRVIGFFPPLVSRLRQYFSQPAHPVEAFGLRFPNPVGLAAGYDKDALAWRGLAALGFGHIEIGTVTPLPQPGNPRPRLFRLPEDQALINRMGFPSHGAEAVARRLRLPRPPGLILGVNLGKNRSTSNEDAAQDYLSLLKTFAPLADYLAINVSSPNTPNLRNLQARQALSALLSSLNAARREQERYLGRRVPLLVKLAPDLSDPDLDDALEALLENAIDGVIAVNTTLQRPPLRSPSAAQSGGLSGAPLRERSLQVVRHIYLRTQGALPIVAVGGILQPEDAARLLEAGACLVQVYTGLVYYGPTLVADILRHLAERAAKRATD